MTLLAQISDAHLGAGRGTPAEDLAAAVAAVERLRPRPDAVLVSGDLTDTGRPEHYAQVQAGLAPLEAPVLLLAGNHDDRDALRAAFPPPGAAGADPGAPYRYATRVGELRLIACDTVLPGRDDGAFGAEQRDWLAEALAADPATPTLVAMHHPPIPVGIPGLDVLGLPEADRAALGRLLAGAPQVAAVLCGHVHAAVAGHLAGVPVRTALSTWRVRPEPRLGDPDLRMAEQPTGYALHAWLDGALVSHVGPL
jgi:3',5'-cyclic-AMP phosphodiesterase